MFFLDNRLPLRAVDALKMQKTTKKNEMRYTFMTKPQHAEKETGFPHAKVSFWVSAPRISSVFCSLAAHENDKM